MAQTRISIVANLDDLTVVEPVIRQTVEDGRQLYSFDLFGVNYIGSTTDGVDGTMLARKLAGIAARLEQLQTEADRQPREHAVPCSLCATPTFDTTAICDRHNQPAEVAS